MIKKLILGLFLILFFPSISQAETREEIEFQLKANLIINQLAQEKRIPSRGDIEKYVFPSIIAHLKKSDSDEWSLQQLERLTNRNPKSFYTNREAFASPGITRIFYQYSHLPTVKSTEKQYFDFIFNPQLTKTNYNFWQTGGTENFVNMLRTSGYLLATKAIHHQIPLSTERQETLKNWLLKKAKKTYQTGTAEWDSSTYTVYNVIGWLNLYDFAEDPQLKKVAKGMLDYYASVMALKYSKGVYGGSEQRGGGAIKSFNTPSDYLGWLWFSDYLPQTDTFAKWPTYLPTIHAATSSYRPPQEAIELARKQLKKPSYYQNTKANYALSRLEIPEFFYISQNYTLGSAIIPQGDQIINWKLVSFSEKDDQALVITGGNSFYKNNKNGMGKTKFDHYLQFENVLLQMTSIPPQVRVSVNRQKLRNLIRGILIQIKCGNTCQLSLEKKLDNLIPLAVYPIKKIDGEYQISSYISWPSQVEIVSQNNVYFLQANQTYIALFPLSPKTSLGKDKQTERNYIETQTNLGQLAGFLLIAGDSLNYQNFQDFQDKILNESQLNLTELAQGVIEYSMNHQSNIKFLFQPNQDWHKLMINQQLIDLKPTQTSLYKGDHLNIKDSILTLKGKESIYEINYQGETPIFNRRQL